MIMLLAGNSVLTAYEAAANGTAQRNTGPQTFQ